MDINTLRGLSTIFVMIVFVGVCWWAFAPSRRKRFQDAANLPFAEDVDAQNKRPHPQADEEKAG